MRANPIKTLLRLLAASIPSRTAAPVRRATAKPGNHIPAPVLSLGQVLNVKP